jgi:hypothetical protein
MLIVTVALASAGVLRLNRHSAPALAGLLPTPRDLSWDLEGIAIPISDSIPAQRRLYAYSVIPGGVQSAEELLAAARNDFVVATHYADFHIERARVITLGRDRAVYVSYRMGSEVFWTNRKISLHQGEALITDGTHEARTRCGNRVSEIPQSPVLPEKQPPLDAFERFPPAGELYTSNLPIDRLLIPPSPFSLLTPAEIRSEGFAPPFVPPIPGSGFGSVPIPLLATGPGSTSGPGSPSGPGGSLIAAPEPSTLLLLGMGLSCLGFAPKFRKRAHIDVVVEKCAGKPLEMNKARSI